MSRTIGYIRTSLEGLGLAQNRADILSLANFKDLGQVEWVEEKDIDTQDWRKRKLGEAFETLQAGDAIIVFQLSHLGRSTLQIIEIMGQAKKRDIAIYAVKGGWTLNTNIETKIVLNLLTMMAEIERDLISERTKKGLRAAKAKGRQLGRPRGPGKSRLDQYREEIEALLKNGSTKSFVAMRYGTTTANLHNWLKKNEIDTSPSAQYNWQC
ncbi:MAG: resolvase [Desulfobacterales bacterium SG8_35_2]|nr:MAG: resolvase [Desulfobacterales bacterium SG8_35_2]